MALTTSLCSCGQPSGPRGSACTGCANTMIQELLHFLKNAKPCAKCGFINQMSLDNGDIYCSKCRQEQSTCTNCDMFAFLATDELCEACAMSASKIQCDPLDPMTRSLLWIPR